MNDSASMQLPQEEPDSLLTKTAEDTHDVVVVTDANGDAIWANRAFAKLTTSGAIDAGSRRASACCSRAPANGREQAAAVLQALGEKKPVKTQILRHKTDGEPAWFDLEVSPLFDAGSRLGGFVAVQREISSCVERNCDLAKAVLSASKAESRFDTALDALSDGFAIFDENDRLLIANQAFCDLHRGLEGEIRQGATFEELLRGALAAGLVDTGGDDPELWISRQLKASLQPSSEMHLHFKRHGWMSRRHKRMENNETVRVWTNISLLKRQQADLEEARARAEAADRAKSAFLADVSHEIRTPLNGIVGFNDLLLRSELTAEQREYATLIESSCRALLSLTDEVLDLNKIERGTLEIASQPFKLAELIAAARGLQALAETKSLKLIIESSLPSETVLAGDSKRIQQIVLNLLGNAIKFTDAGSVRLAISRENNGLQLTVSDTGRGIPADRLPFVFERFYRADEPGLPKRSGSGLGLAIAKDLARLMGGDIAVDSDRGRGSAFTVSLPLRLDAEKAAGAGSKRAPAEAAAKLALARAYEVLVAEDNPINLRLAEALLHAAGCNVQSAANGQEALAKVEQSEYDLIVMDSQMPLMNGLEAIKSVRRRQDWKSRTPILSLTANAMKGAEEMHASAGADMYMSKPLRSDCFIDAVKRLGEKGRALRESEGGAPEAPPQAKAS
jgi:PAS domain S-box-containing protein